MGVGMTLLEIAILAVIYCFNRQGNTMQSQTKTSSSYGSESYSAQSDNSSSNKSNHYDDSSTKWEEFAGTTYRVSQWVSDRMQYYAFSYTAQEKGSILFIVTIPAQTLWKTKWSSLYTK